MDAEMLGHVDDGRDQGSCLLVALHAADESLINLQNIEVEVLQCAES